MLNRQGRLIRHQPPSGAPPNITLSQRIRGEDISKNYVTVANAAVAPVSVFSILPEEVVAKPLEALE